MIEAVKDIGSFSIAVLDDIHVCIHCSNVIAWCIFIEYIIQNLPIQSIKYMLVSYEVCEITLFKQYYNI